MNKINLAIIIGLTISGCGSNVDKIKDGVMDFDKSITVSQAFDNWKSCKNSKWSEFLTDNGKNMVEFSCEAVDYQPYMNQVKETFAKIVIAEKEWYPSSYKTIL
jgi:hypothetical protein